LSRGVGVSAGHFVLRSPRSATRWPRSLVCSVGMVLTFTCSMCQVSAFRAASTVGTHELLGLASHELRTYFCPVGSDCLTLATQAIRSLPKTHLEAGLIRRASRIRGGDFWGADVCCGPASGDVHAGPNPAAGTSKEGGPVTRPSTEACSRPIGAGLLTWSADWGRLKRDLSSASSAKSSQHFAMPRSMVRSLVFVVVWASSTHSLAYVRHSSDVLIASVRPRTVSLSSCTRNADRKFWFHGDSTPKQLFRVDRFDVQRNVSFYTGWVEKPIHRLRPPENRTSRRLPEGRN
jgi:hypothetical protein